MSKAKVSCGKDLLAHLTYTPPMQHCSQQYVFFVFLWVWLPPSWTFKVPSFASSREIMQRTQFYHLMLLPLIRSSQQPIKAFSTCTYSQVFALSVKMYLLFPFLTRNPNPIGVIATDGFDLSLFHLEIKQNTFLSHLTQDTVSETSDMEPPAPFLKE